MPHNCSAGMSTNSAMRGVMAVCPSAKRAARRVIKSNQAVRSRILRLVVVKSTMSRVSMTSRGRRRPNSRNGSNHTADNW